jgi:hypothetical protein
MQFIDTQGMIHFGTADNKAKAVKSLKTLKEGTEIRWLGKNEVFVSQQYLSRK